jgi:small neutral amino acid transporter SnatA (MarC family)
VEFLPESFNGLPLHPLVVHAAVVLVPLAGVLALLMVAVPRFSVRFGPLIVILGWGALGATLVAKETGEMLAKQEKVPVLHAESGDLMPLFAGVQALLITILWLADRRSGRGLLGILVALLTVVAVVAAGYWVYRTGDSGAQAVWD